MPETSGQPVKRPPTPDWVNALGKAEGLSTYTPTLREKVANYLNSTFYGDSREGQGRADKVVNWVETMVPPAAAADMVYSAGREGAKGNYVGAGLNLAMMGLPAARKGMQAWHVSPHDWSVPRWDAEVRGTGEGAQMYGDGFYAAQSPRVSGLGGHYWEQFFRKLSGPERTAATWLKQPGVNFDREAAANLGQQVLDMHRSAPGNFVDDPIELGHRYETALDMLRSGKRIPPYTYQLKLDMSPNNLIQWDTPLSMQPMPVKRLADDFGVSTVHTPLKEEDFMKTFRENFDLYNKHIRTPKEAIDPKTINMIMKDPTGYMWGQAAIGGDPGFWHAWTKATQEHKLKFNPTYEGAWYGNPEDTGKDLYRDLTRKHGVSKMQDVAKKNDVHGTMFLDGNSRDKGEGTHNFAIWTPQLIDVLKKLGIALPAAGAAGMVAADKQKEVQ